GDNFNSLRAVLWENGAPVDLNTRILDNPAGLYLQLAEGINSRGEFVGFAQTPAGDTHVYLATTSNSVSASESFSPAARCATSPLALSEDARRLLFRRLRIGGR